MLMTAGNLLKNSLSLKKKGTSLALASSFNIQTVLQTKKMATKKIRKIRLSKSLIIL